jgi:hypothetical protein
MIKLDLSVLLKLLRSLSDLSKSVMVNVASRGQAP